MEQSNLSHNTSIDQRWNKRKSQSGLLAQSFERLGNYKKAERISYCGSYLQFNECPNGHYKNLNWANFCRDRLCPMCAWRRSLRYSTYIHGVAHEINKRQPVRWVFLTLTVRNVEEKGLSSALDHLFQSWQRFSQRKAFRQVVEGWFRGLEVSRNNTTHTYHPHFHALLAVDPLYFSEGKYLTNRQWSELWKQSLRVEYNPIVDIRVIKPNERNRRKENEVVKSDEAMISAIIETAKYPTKPGNYLFPSDQDTTDEVVSTLDKALRNRRLLAFGGALKDVWRELREADDLTDERKNCNCPTCGSDLLEHLYRWNFGLKSYFHL